MNDYCPACEAYNSHEPWCPHYVNDHEVGRVWVTAKVLNETGSEWELVGIFDSKELATSACKEWNYCIWPMHINLVSPDKTTIHPEAVYPVQR